MPRTLLVFGQKKFKITIPDDAKVTFGPFSPPPRKSTGFEWSDGAKAGTLRIYGKTQKDILACFSQVYGFRDLSVEYMEEIISEGGTTMWKSDEHGIVTESQSWANKQWVKGEHQALPPKRERRK